MFIIKIQVDSQWQCFIVKIQINSQVQCSSLSKFKLIDQENVLIVKIQIDRPGQHLLLPKNPN